MFVLACILVVPKFSTNFNTEGKGEGGGRMRLMVKRSFCVAAAKLWNNLPVLPGNVRTSDSLSVLKLK